MKKLDRFEKMAEQEYQTWLNGDMSQRGWLQVADRCQRRQYAALRRLVKRQNHWTVRPIHGECIGQHNSDWISRDGLLAAMDQWKQKGER